MIEVVAELEAARAERRGGGGPPAGAAPGCAVGSEAPADEAPADMTSPHVNAAASRIHMACLPRRDAQSLGWPAQNIAYPEIPDIAAVTVPRMNDTTIMTSAETSMYGISWADGVPMIGVRPR